jgi:predicted dehydrogenase
MMGPANADNSIFLSKYPEELVYDLRSFDDIVANFAKDEPLIFYFPCLPGFYREFTSIKILKHFTNSIMLIEKPTNNTAEDALSYKTQLEAEGVYNRLVFGQHDALDPSRVYLLHLAKTFKSDVREIRIKFNYPKSQSVPGDKRIFDKKVGGTLLDLGVYNIRLAHDLLNVLDLNLSDFDRD